MLAEHALGVLSATVRHKSFIIMHWPPFIVLAPHHEQTEWALAYSGTWASSQKPASALLGGAQPSGHFPLR